MGTRKKNGMEMMTIISGVSYFFCSASMVLANKFALTYMPIPAVICALQYLFSLLVVEAVALSKRQGVERVTADVDPWTYDKIISYWKVPCFFAVAIFSNNKVLQYANVETFIVFRNSTPLFVCALDFLLMQKSLPNLRTIASFCTIVIGTTVYVVTDDNFEVRTSFWIVIYLVVIVGEMIYVKHVFTKVPMSTWTRVKYTNGLSLIAQPILLLVTMEFNSFGDVEVNLMTVTAVFLSCLGGFAISFSATEFRSRVSATTFTVTGVVNKMLTVTVNYFMWDKHANHIGLAALAFTIFGAFMYRPAPIREMGSFSHRVHSKIADLFP